MSQNSLNQHVKSLLKHLEKSPSVLLRVCSSLQAANGIVIKEYAHGIWNVIEGSTYKYVFSNDDAYHCFFDKRNGFSLRFGKTLEDDPTWCQLGNSIADIEVVSGKCPKINGHNCRFCYKSNGGETAKCMSLAEAGKLLDFINQNGQLEQVAWGITGFYTNPDFEKILELSKDKGIIPNYTTNGVDIDDHAIDVTLKNCGRVAVSCYEGAKDLCYSTIKRFGDAAKARGMKFPCNIHVVLSKATYPHVMEVLKDAAGKKIENLGAVVILRMKNVGRASILDPHIPDEMYEEIVKFCLDNKVVFGFDSCGCHRVENVLRKINREDLISSIDPCESSRFSAYFNVDSKFYNCSFCEQLKDHTAIDPYKYNSYYDFWNSDEVNKLRNPPNGWACKSCPFMNID